MRWYACGPEKSDDHDDDTSLGLIGEREGHCGCLLAPKRTCTQTEACDPMQTPSWAVVLGGYCEGELCGTPLAARVSLRYVDDTSTSTTIVAPEWTELSYDEACEKDGASLTRWTADTALLFGGLDCEFERCASVHTVQMAFTDNSEVEVDVCVSAPLVVNGEVPTPRSRHSAAMLGDQLFVFAGETDSSEQTADLFVLDARTLMWRRVHAAGTPAPSLWPSPRLLCGPLLFVSATQFVVYGGAHYVDGGILSLRDGWCFDIHRDVFTPLWGDATEPPSVSSGLPSCNGHIGGCYTPLVCDGERASAVACAVFAGGKDASEGSDAVKCVRWSQKDPTRASTSLEDVQAVTLMAEGTPPTHAPHWRYMSVGIQCGPHGLLLVGGNCRHPKGAAVYYLSFL